MSPLWALVFGTARRSGAPRFVLPDGGGQVNIYGASPTKRSRSTKAEIEALETAIYEVCESERPLTIRGCFYRVMSQGLVPKTEAGYRRVQNRALLMRRAGSLPYHWIADNTRWQSRPTTYSSVDAALSVLSWSYRRALWDNQGFHVELWVEKDAIASVVSSTTREWDIPLMVARGFPSESFLWSTAREIVADGKPAVIYQLGDHDASGVAAWEQTKRKITEFVDGQVDLTFQRLAVTPEQIELFGLPTRPQKKSDTRAAKFTGECVEVDAMPSEDLRRIVTAAIEEWIDADALRITRVAEQSEREGLKALATTGMIGGAR